MPCYIALSASSYHLERYAVLRQSKSSRLLDTEIKQVPFLPLITLQHPSVLLSLFCLDLHTLRKRWRCAGKLQLSLRSFPSLSDFQSVPGLVQPTAG
jgi:hypothetical protein